jgi:hypothetical protein
MKVEVSLGEAVDKISILHLKMKKIVDENKRIEIQKEINCLQECYTYIKQYNYFYDLLMFVNEKIWDLTDIIKTNPHNYAEISKDIFDYNQKRFRIKNWFNLLTNSNIKEQKSYSLTNCYIDIDETICFSKLSQICYLALEYDTITISHSNILSILNIPTIQIKIDSNDLKETNIQTTNIHSLDFDIPDVFTFTVPPTTYIVGGMLGDFIQSLSVICENYYKTGSKGILYMSEHGDTFRNGLLNTYNDVYPVIIKQKYIQEFKIYENEPFQINLVKWRQSPILTTANWYNIYKSTYDVEWGKRKWIEWNYNPLWNNKIVINTTNYRFPVSSIFFNNLNKDLEYVFLSSDISQFEFFKKHIKNNIVIHYCQFKTFDELVTIVNSCKLFIGGFSAPLSIANALHKDRIICNSSTYFEVKMNDLIGILPNIKMII